MDETLGIDNSFFRKEFRRLVFTTIKFKSSKELDTAGDFINLKVSEFGKSCPQKQDSSSWCLSSQVSEKGR
jgi:hypothetical protein